MKALVSFLVLVLSVAAPASQAQSGSMKGMEVKNAEAQTTHKGSGTVTRVDRANGRVTIAHGPVQSLKWPAMTMAFGVKDRSLLEKLPVGKKIEFEFVQRRSDYIVTDAR